jgi:hypothetical protein
MDGHIHTANERKRIENEKSSKLRSLKSQEEKIEAVKNSKLRPLKTEKEKC